MPDGMSTAAPLERTASRSDERYEHGELRGTDVKPAASYVDEHPQSGNGPDEMPEVLREMTLIRGVMVGTERAVEELLSRLDGVRHNRPEASEINKQSIPPVVTPMGQDLRRIYNDLSNLTDRVLRVTGQLHL